MTNHPSRSTLPAILEACRKERLEAGSRRDGCGVAHITPVLKVLNALAATCSNLATARYVAIATERDKATMTKMMCEIHDKAARGELSGDNYREVLFDARITAQSLPADDKK